jgi:hypothetical protein
MIKKHPKINSTKTKADKEYQKGELEVTSKTLLFGKTAILTTAHSQSKSHFTKKIEKNIKT